MGLMPLQEEKEKKSVPLPCKDRRTWLPANRKVLPADAGLAGALTLDFFRTVRKTH